MASWSLTHLSPPAALRARPQSPPGEDFLYKPISRARLRRARPSGLDRVQTRERECMKGLRDTVYGHTPSQTACGQLADSGGGRPAAPLRAEALRARSEPPQVNRAVIRRTEEDPLDLLPSRFVPLLGCSAPSEYPLGTPVVAVSHGHPWRPETRSDLDMSWLQVI